MTVILALGLFISFGNCEVQFSDGYHNVYYLQNFGKALNSTETLAKKHATMLLEDTRALKVNQDYDVSVHFRVKIYINFSCWKIQVPGYDRINNFQIGVASTGQDVQVPLERISNSTLDVITAANKIFHTNYDLVKKIVPKCKYCVYEDSSPPDNPLDAELRKKSKFSTENFAE